MKVTVNISDGFKKTKVGIIPTDWRVINLGSLIDIQSGNSPSTFNLENGGSIPYIKVEDLNNSSKYQNTSRYHTNLNKGVIPINSILFPKRGAAILNNKVRINKVPVQMDSNMMAIYPKTEKIDYEYLYYKITFQKLFRIADTSTIPQINNKHILPYKISLPPLPEQQKIAEILSTWDLAISTTQNLIAELKLRNKGLAQQLLTGKKRLKGFEEEWKKYLYSEILKKVKRPVKWNDETLFNLISVRRRSGGIFYRDALYGYQIKVKNLHTAKKGDFLFSKMQIVHGASALVTPEFDEAKISGSYISVRAKEESILLMEFFNLYSKIPKFYHQTFIASYGVHIEKMTFNFDLFLTDTIQLPRVEEQKAIVSLLSESEKELKLYQKQLETLKEQKKGLMQKLLTGEVRVKTKEK